MGWHGAGTEHVSDVATLILWLRRRRQECYDLTESVLERDPYALECLPSHLASAVELRKKNELFLRGHMCAPCIVTLTRTLILALPQSLTRTVTLEPEWHM